MYILSLTYAYKHNRTHKKNAGKHHKNHHAMQYLQKWTSGTQQEVPAHEYILVVFVSQRHERTAGYHDQSA
jgi:hypothetical protein